MRAATPRPLATSCPTASERLPDDQGSVLSDVNDDVRRVLDAHRAATLAAVLALLRDFVLDGVRQRASGRRSHVSGPAGLGARSAARQSGRSASARRSATSASSSTSSRTPIRSRPRSPSTWPPTNATAAAAGTTGATSRLVPGQAVPGRRSQAEHLPLPPAPTSRSTTICCERLERCQRAPGRRTSARSGR